MTITRASLSTVAPGLGAFGDEPWILSADLSEEPGSTSLLAGATVLREIRRQQERADDVDLVSQTRRGDVQDNVGVPIGYDQGEQVVIDDCVNIVSVEVALDEIAGGEAAAGVAQPEQHHPIVIA